MGDLPVFVGGIIPEADRETLGRTGVTRVYTPGQATLTAIISDIVDTVGKFSARATERA